MTYKYNSSTIRKLSVVAKHVFLFVFFLAVNMFFNPVKLTILTWDSMVADSWRQPQWPLQEFSFAQEVDA